MQKIINQITVFVLIFFSSHILAADDIPEDLPNVFAHNFVQDMGSLYRNTSALLRFTIHDGLSKMVLEALSYGRHVLWTESFPHCHLVRNFDDCLKILTSLKKSSTLNIKGHQFVKSNYNPQKIARDYLAFYQKIKEKK